MLDRRKKGKPRKGGPGIVPEEPAVWSALERAGVVIVMGEKPRTKPGSAPRPKLKRPR